MVNRNKFQILQNECSTCIKCSLSATRNNVVFGRGNPNSKLFVIGEGPGQQEDEQGLAFVGRAGKMLASFLKLNTPRDKVPGIFCIPTNKGSICFFTNILCTRILKTK